ncbi:MAG: GAF domain-containing protein [Anaerolineales bacterium]|nr:MAG: GAF domain-containing protein [Anaerolineales bacterium]
MIARIFDYFSAEEDQDPSFIRLTRNIVIFVIASNIALLPLVTGAIGEGSRNPVAFVTLCIAIILEGISLYYVLQGRIHMAKVVVPFALIAAVVIVSLNTNGLKNTSLVGLPIILVISAILLGRRSLFLAAPLAVLGVIVIAVMDLSGRIEFVPAGLDDAFIIAILLIVCAGIIQLLIGRLNESIQRTRRSEKIQKEENLELNELRTTLEERVNQRTAELETANRSILRRARQFEAVTQVLQAVSSIQDLEALLPRITQVISDQFRIYHTGVFLLDRDREFAVLRAANSEGGQKMLMRGHKLQVGQTGIVGFVTATGQPRIALDVGADAVFFDNPNLPNTRSEIALPLRYAGQIIGALDVQSTEANAFVQDDIEVLIALADQVSIAINNTLAIEEARKSLTEAQSAIGESTRESWKVMRPKSLGLGIQLIDTNIAPLQKPLEGDYIREAVEKGETVLSNKPNEPSKLAIPIRLRGQVVGVMNLRGRDNHTLTEDAADIAEAVAERLSLAIETATLLQATQHRADIERVTTEITSRISSSTRFETILQTAAQELSRALGGSDVLVQIEPVALELNTGAK